MNYVKILFIFPTLWVGRGKTSPTFPNTAAASHISLVCKCVCLCHTHTHTEIAILSSSISLSLSFSVGVQHTTLRRFWRANECHDGKLKHSVTIFVHIMALYANGRDHAVWIMCEYHAGSRYTQLRVHRR